MVQHSKTSEGFGLLELIGALAVFAISMVPLFSLEGGLLRNASTALRSWSSLIAAKNSTIEHEKTGNEQDTESVEVPGGLPGQTLRYTSDLVPEQSSAQLFSFGRKVNATLEEHVRNKVKRTTYVIFKPIIKRDDKAEEKDAKSEKRRRRPRKKKGAKTTSKGKSAGKKTGKKTGETTTKEEVRGKID